MSIKPGSKYYPLFEYLSQCDQPQVTLSFEEINRLIGGKLPASAWTHKAWWSNRDSAGAVQASAWVQASYQVDTVDFEQKTVTFCKFQAQYRIQRVDGNIVWNREAIRALRKHMGLTQARFADELGVRRQTVSEWENGVYEPDRTVVKLLQLVSERANFDAISQELEGDRPE